MIGEFEQSVRMHPHRTFFAFVAKDGSVESYTYWEARLLSAAIARRLMDHGVRQGDYVAVDLANHPMLVFLSLAAAYGGFGLVLLNHRLTEAEKMSRLFDMERAPGSEEADLPPTRGTNEKLNVNKTRAWTLMPKPKSFSPGAKMYVVSACKSNERNFEYKAKNGKTYGSLTYFIFSMMVKTMDFNQWTNRITTKTPSTPAIFQTFQHPQKQIYK